MSRRASQRKLLAVLGLVALLLAGAIVLVWQQDRRDLGERDRMPVRIEIAIPGTPLRTLKQADDGERWHQDGKPVDMSRLTPLLELLATRHRRGASYPSSEVDLTGAGLDAPSGTLTLTDADGTRQVLQIGGQDVAGKRRYVLEDTRVLLLPDWLWPLVQRGL